MRKTKYKLSISRIRKIRTSVAKNDFNLWSSFFGQSLSTVYSWERPNERDRRSPTNPEILLMLKMENQIEEEGVK